MTLSQKPATFAITWVVYASSYLLRKPLGIIKSDLQTNYNLTCNQLGWLGTSFHLPYALVQITLGNLGDKYGAPRVITASMIVASVLCSLLASGNPLSSLPPMAKSLSDTYGGAKVATIFGIWGTCIFVGEIAGTGLAVQLQKIYSPDLKMVFVDIPTSIRKRLECGIFHGVAIPVRARVVFHHVLYKVGQIFPLHVVAHVPSPTT